MPRQQPTKSCATAAINRPCDQCPWRLANQGRRHKGFYTKANLKRLWNGLRTGNGMSCHPTDPSHPDHGAKPDSTPRECAGAVVLIRRELEHMADGQGRITDESVLSYLKARRGGLTKKGILFWVVQRIAMAGVPYVGGQPLPEVDPMEPSVVLPEFLR